MPSWNEVLEEIESCKRIDALDFVRRKYITKLHDITGRNIIAYYSGWLQKPGIKNTGINDDDKNGLMATIHGLDRNLGLDLVLHTPGGDIAATESIVDYLRKMFGTDIRVIVPQLAMSAGTMIACASKEIIMGKESNLGPIDPQFNGLSTYGVIEEFQRAITEIQANPATIPIWQIIVNKYHPTFIGDCEKAIQWSTQMVCEWLKTGMFSDDPEKDTIVDRIVKELSDHYYTKNHSRHIPLEECTRLGLKVVSLEEYMREQDFQDCVLTIHHSFMHTFAQTSAYKIIENHAEKAMIQMSAPPSFQAIQPMQALQPPSLPPDLIQTTIHNEN
ncbi:MAG: hypothetical protein K0R55_2084 [Sporomusa sp.]|jgi:hypothetical protein|nr:hypothetical protein [Sporomusa sp.]